MRNGRTSRIARRCDAALGSGRTLAALVEVDQESAARVPHDPALARTDGGLPAAATDGWLIRVSPDGSGLFVVPGPPDREFVHGPAPMSWAPAPAASGSAEGVLAALLDGFRIMAKSMSPASTFRPSSAPCTPSGSRRWARSASAGRA